MALILDHCIPSDAPELAEAYISTFERQPRHQVTYGGIPRPRQLTMFTKEFESGIASQNSPTPTKESHWLKVTDPASGEIMAYAIWDWLPHGYKMEEDAFASVKKVPEGANERFMRDFARMTGELRGGHEGRRGPHWCTHPKYERKGAGAMLIRWPFAQADKECLKCYVDGSNVGYPLYRKCGFKDVGELVVDFDEYGGKGMGVGKWVGMLRERVALDPEDSPEK